MASPYDQDPTSWAPRTEPLGRPAAPVPPPYPPQLPPTHPMPPYPLPMSGPPTSPTPYYPQTMPMPPYQQPQPPQVIVVQQPQRPSSGMATASMVLGIVGLTLCLCFTFGIPSILAVIFGHLALSDIKKTNKGGHGQAVAGLVTGYVGVAPAVILSVWVVFAGAIGSVIPTPTPTP